MRTGAATHNDVGVDVVSESALLFLLRDRGGHDRASSQSRAAAVRGQWLRQMEARFRPVGTTEVAWMENAEGWRLARLRDGVLSAAAPGELEHPHLHHLCRERAGETRVETGGESKAVARPPSERRFQRAVRCGVHPVWTAKSVSTRSARSGALGEVSCFALFQLVGPIPAQRARAKGRSGRRPF